MKNSMGEFPSEYEEMLAKLETQITELFSEIHYYQALVTEKENKITRLTTENFQLKTQLQSTLQQVSPPPRPMQDYPHSSPSQDSYTPPPPMQRTTPTVPSSEDTRINKRVCPECGAMGFAIKEVDDKSRIISYVPRRIYAKKKVCTKCRCEFF